MTTIYHNPRCSKSRATLELLESQGIDAEIILYLEQPPDATTLSSIIEKLGCSVKDIIRKGENIYSELGLSEKTLSDEELIDIVTKNPKLLERPIVVNGDKAAVGRPPESVLSLY